MKVPNIIPPADLLKQIEGIESGLLQRKRLGKIGIVAAALQTVALVVNNDWWQKLIAFNWHPSSATDWLFLLVVTGSAVSFLLVGWSKFWLKESEEPFRYTYSIADFEPIEAPKKDARISLLSHDLSERLSERIRRLSLLSEDDAKKSAQDAKGTETDGETKPRSHIHVKGYYVVRERADEQWFIEVMPRVRIGPPGSPETLAHSVKFKLKPDGAKTDATSRPVKVDEYEKILERVYFSIATEIYKQIQRDVKRKIDLLPTKHFRAAALLHEADDYAGSNTLDAYNEALKLYGEAMELYDPKWKALSESPWRRAFQRFQRLRARLWTIERAWEASLLPSFGHVEVMCARAELGYANMLLYHRALAGISGGRLNPVFEACPIAASAVARLKRLPADVPGRNESLFDANVTLALAWQYLTSSRKAEEQLIKARQLDPRRAERDARYLFVTGEIELQRRSKLQLLRRAVEIDPRFEVAQFSLAVQFEMLWRSRPALERNVAEMVFKEYEEVLKVNPGNVGAWANLGYMRWLLQDMQESYDAYESGREYKEIKRETFVAELDYGLARLAAEHGDFEQAYEYYVSAVAAHFAQGFSHAPEGFSGYLFAQINDAMRNRFEQYKETVEKRCGLWESKDGKERSLQEVIDDFTVDAARGPAIAGLVDLFKCVSKRMSRAERELLKKSLQDGDLSAFGQTLGDRLSADSAHTLAILRQHEFEALIKRHFPTQRVRRSVHAFVLSEYGEACNSYYYQTGDDEWSSRGRSAQKQAIERNPNYVLPYYRLGRNQEVELLEPNWPDGILAMAEDQAQLALKNNNSAWDEDSKTRDKRKMLEELRSQIKKTDTPFAVTRHISGIPSRKDHGGEGGTVVSVRSGEMGQDYKPQEHEKRTKEELEEQARRQTRELEAEARNKIKESEEEIEKLKDAIEKYETKSQKLKEEAGEAEKKALEGLKKLLPHECAESALADMTGKGVPLMLANKQIIWEREFDDLHVMALFTWTRILSFQTDKAPFEAAKRLIRHIQGHFWPVEWGVFDLIRQLSERERKETINEARKSDLERLIHECIEKQRDLLIDWLMSDPTNHVKLSNLASILLSVRQKYQKNIEVILHRAQAESTNLRALRQIALIFWACGKYPESLDKFSQLAAAAGENDKTGARWRKESAEDLLPHITSHETYRVVQTWLRHELENKQLDKTNSRDAREALLLLTQRKYRVLMRGAGTDSSLFADLAPVVTPIAVEADGKLFPHGDRVSDSHPLFTKHIPEMRSRIESQMGVKTPSVRVRPNDVDMPANTYLIMINEVPLVMGTVDPARKFCADCDALGKIREKAVVDSDRAYNPLTGEKDGAWIEAGQWEKVQSAGVPLFDWLEYVIFHVEGVVRDNLTAFVGLQEVDDLLNQWYGGQDQGRQRHELIDRALPDLNRRVRFVQVLHGLLRESVPVTNFGRVLEAFQRHDSSNKDVIRVIEAVRLELKENLPGNDGFCQILSLSPGFEREIKRWISERDGKVFFAVAPENTQELLLAVRAAVGERNQRRLVIATETEGIRAFVRRLIELEFPRVMVSSSAELRAGWRNDVCRVVEYEFKNDGKDAHAAPRPAGQRTDERRKEDGVVEAVSIGPRCEQIDIMLSAGYCKKLFNVEPKDEPISVHGTAMDAKVRQSFAMMGDGLFYELGIRAPDIFLNLSTSIKENAFAIKLDHEGPVRDGLKIDQLLVNVTTDQLKGLGITTAIEAVNPANNTACSIIAKADEQAIKEKLPDVYSWNPVGYMILALAAALRRDAWRLIDADAVEYELAMLHRFFPELTLATMERIPCERLARILIELLREEISIRDLRGVLERALTYDYIVTDPMKYIIFDDRLAVHERLNLGAEDDVYSYAQYIRAGLKRWISHKYTRGRSTLIVYLLDPKVEERVVDELAYQRGTDSGKPLKSDEVEAILAAIHSEVGSPPPSAAAPVILTTSAIRFHMRHMVAKDFPSLAVIAYEELSPDMNIQPIARISAPNLG